MRGLRVRNDESGMDRELRLEASDKGANQLFEDADSRPIAICHTAARPKVLCT